MTVSITWIAHACLRVSAGPINVYFDPYQVPAGLPPATLVLVSHDHYDHADSQSIKKLLGPSTIVACPTSCVKTLSAFDPVGMSPGETRSFGEVSVTAVPSCTFPGKKFHPRENGWLGYVVEAGGRKVYHAGDCDIMDDMAALAPLGIDVAMLPVGNKGFTMDFADAARATALVKPRAVIPMHDWDQDLEPFKALVEKRAPGVAVEILKGGKALRV